MEFQLSRVFIVIMYYAHIKRILWFIIHLFAIGGGQSPKLIQHRSKTRHLTQQLVQRDWPMCVTIRRNLVSVRHSA